MSLAALMPSVHWQDGHLVLARRVAFRLTRAEEVAPEFEELLAEAYHLGEQRHVRPR